MGSMGMMHEGYFVGRKELTNWIRQYFEPAFQKVEDLANGVVYCQILNTIYPGAIQMSKVKMTAKTEVDFIHNFKILQAGFNKKKIDRFIDVDKLTKRSFQFNMEFLQFMKTYWDMHAPDGLASGESAPFKEAAPNQAPPPLASQAQQQTRKSAAAGGAARRAPAASAARSSAPAAHSSLAAAGVPAGLGAKADEELLGEVTELKLSVENLERERDFYYAKLREVEVLCQQKESENIPFLNEVLAILYKMDDGDDFVTPEATDEVYDDVPVEAVSLEQE